MCEISIHILIQQRQHTLPVASYWLETPEPLPMLLPNTVREKQRELVALPELEKTKIPIRHQEMREKVLEEVIPVEVITDEDS
jgi:carbon dioxide concentrating mechanism protein CcmO